MPETLDTATDALDEAFAILAGTGPEYLGGLANHGPMAAEALHRMGRTDAVVPWTRRYATRLEAAAPPGRALADDECPSALGHLDRYPEWVARFARELEERPWTEVAAWWAPVLVPGLWGAACHGVLRASHAVRAIGDHDSPARRAELARGLAYWAAAYEELPGGTRLAGPLGLVDAMDGVRALPVPALSGVFITERVEQLCTVPGLPDAVDALGSVSVTDLTGAFARAYLVNAREGAIAFVHSVTGPAALRPLLALLPADQHRGATGAAWRASAVILGAFGERGTGAAGPLGGDDELPEPVELVDRAIASGDEHAIKLTAACLDEHARHPDRAYLLAAVDVSARLRA